MLAAWQAGLPIHAEQWIERHKVIQDDPEFAVLVIYEELCLREERGETVDSAEFYRRFPQFRDALSVVLGCHRLICADEPSYPRGGEEFGEFRLIRELGRGGAGRVFLATQPALSDRPLVLKLTPRTGDEHLSLARLQHTHIVPLFLVQEFPERGLRTVHAVSRQCQLGVGLADALHVECPWAARTVDRAGARSVAIAARHGPQLAWPGDWFSRAGFVRTSGVLDWFMPGRSTALSRISAACSTWISSRPMSSWLATVSRCYWIFTWPMRSSRYNRVKGWTASAARRVTCHRNNSFACMRCDPGTLCRWDWTLVRTFTRWAFCFTSRSRDKCRQSARKNRARGCGRLVPRSAAGWKICCTSASRGSGQAVTRMRARWQSTCGGTSPICRCAALPITACRERWKKWRKRKPHALSTWAVSLAGLVAIGCASALFYNDRVQTARSALRQAEQRLADGDHAAALERLTGGLQAIRWLPGHTDLKQNIRTQLVAVQKARVGGALHGLVEQLRFLDSLSEVPAAKRRDLDEGCRAIWQARGQIATVKLSAAGGENNDQNDWLDLVLLWTGLLARDSKAGNFEFDRERALTIVDEAHDMWGPSPALDLAKARLTAPVGAGLMDEAALSAAVPQTAWEFDVVGRSLMQAGKLDEAREYFEQATRLEPAAFWPYFHLEICDFRSGRIDEALRWASVCVALSPQRAECFFNRALCFRARTKRGGAARPGVRCRARCRFRGG